MKNFEIIFSARLTGSRLMRCALLCGLLPIFGKAWADEAKAASNCDATFIHMLQESNAYELEICKLARDKVSSAPMREKIISKQEQDQSTARELDDMASIRGYDASPPLDKDSKALIEQLAVKSGPDYDRVVLANLYLVQLKKKAACVFELKFSNDSELKAFAEKEAASVQPEIESISNTLK